MVLSVKKSKMNINKLHRYIKNDLTAQEKTEVLSWIAKSEKNKQKFIALKNIWVMCGIAGSHRAITFSETAKRKTIGQSFMRYAAIMVLGLIIGAVGMSYMNLNSSTSGTTIIEVPTGERSILTLPDGTKVWLNAESKISYASNFYSKNRAISFEGEAFFEVQEDTEHPFLIETNYGTIEVLGTTFNLQSYDDLPFETTLVTGKVRFTSPSKQQCELTPNQKLSILSGELLVNEVKALRGDEWKSDGFYFDNEDFKSIVRNLERQFDVEITLDSSLNNLRFSGKIYRTTLPEVLQIISKTQPLDYHFSDDHRRVEISTKIN